MTSSSDDMEMEHISESEEYNSSSSSSSEEPEIDPSTPQDDETDNSEAGTSTSGKKRGLSLVFKNLNYSIPAKRTLKQKILREKLPHRHLLKDVTGAFLPGRLVAIMGPSGAGKTTLLSLLAGRIKQGGGSKISGEVTVNGTANKHFKGKMGSTFKNSAAFVMQDDIMLANLNPRELIRFSAMLRLDKSISRKEKYERVEKLLKQLNLIKCSTTRVGQAGELTRGVSGGERKRTSIGIELVTDPDMIFLDEPTTGLDSTISLSLIKILKNLCRTSNKSIISTIHQPSSEVFFEFDDLYLLSDGNLLYGGPVKKLVSYFKRIDLPFPKYSNPSHHLLNVASSNWNGRILWKKEMNVLDDDVLEEGEMYDEQTIRDHTTDHTEYEQKEQILEQKNKTEFQKDIATMTTAYAEYLKAEKFDKLSASNLEFKEAQTTEIVKKAKPNRLMQTFLLFWRQSLQTYRGSETTTQQLVMTIVINVMFGLVFLQLDHNQKGKNDRLGVIMIVLMNQFFLNVQTSLTVFAAERPLFSREYSNKVYSLLSYFISKSVVDLPGLVVFPLLAACIVYWMSALEEGADNFFIFVAILIIMVFLGQSFGMLLSSYLDVAQALQVMPIIVIPMVLLGGFFLNPDNTPNWLIWLQYISVFYWGFQALCINEFGGGTTYTCDDDEYIYGENDTKTCPITNSDQILVELSFDEREIWQCVLVLIGMIILVKFASIGLLYLVSRKKVTA